MRDKLFSVLTLFSATGTLLCCVLPAVVATLAGGAAVGAMVGSLPWLIPLSQNKEWLFVIAGLLIVMDSVLLFRPNRSVACDVTGGSGCAVTGKFSKIMLCVAVVIYVIGAFFSYALVPLMVVMGMSS